VAWLSVNVLVSITQLLSRQNCLILWLATICAGGGEQEG